ncbi:40S ribosomal protein S27-B [Meyerozyma guilliermondii]
MLHKGPNGENEKNFSPLKTSDTCTMVLVQDLLNPNPASEAKKHKLKTLVPQPRSYFMDVKCQGCLNITTVFSHAQTAVTCDNCSTVLCTPTGGKAKLTEGSSYRRK